MSYEEYPMPRPKLLVNDSDGWLIDPMLIPFALGALPYIPLFSMGLSDQHAELYQEAEPAEPCVPWAAPGNGQMRRPRRFRAFLKSVRLIRS